MADFDLKLTPRHNKTGGGLFLYKNPPIRAFKHVSAEYADSFQSGNSIQIATYEYYTKGENNRADPLEGKAINRSGNGSVLREAQLGNAGAISFMNALVGNGWNSLEPEKFVLHNVSLIQKLPPSYIFCASLAPDLERIASGERCFMIDDLIEFAYQLMQVRPELLASVMVAPVVYEVRDVDVQQHDFRESNPFLKNERFRAENEVRIVFKPGQIPEDPLRLKMPFTPRLVTEVFGKVPNRGKEAFITIKSPHGG
jgi:hypothetical protein